MPLAPPVTSTTLSWKGLDILASCACAASRKTGCMCKVGLKPTFAARSHGDARGGVCLRRKWGEVGCNAHDSCTALITKYHERDRPFFARDCDNFTRRYMARSNEILTNLALSEQTGIGSPYSLHRSPTRILSYSICPLPSCSPLVFTTRPDSLLSCSARTHLLHPPVLTCILGK
jgi:hypothetical protein